jgi:hypothetical protein
MPDSSGLLFINGQPESDPQLVWRLFQVKRPSPVINFVAAVFVITSISCQKIRKRPCLLSLPRMAVNDLDDGKSSKYEENALARAFKVPVAEAIHFPPVT